MAVIKVLKLTTGDEIIGIVQDGRDMEAGEDGFTVENLLFVTAPLKVISRYDEKLRAHSLYLSDWVPSIGEETLPLDKRNILTLGNPNTDLESHYYELILAKDMKDQAKKQEATQQLEDDAEDKLLKELLKECDFDDDDLN
jgi:hypothetical protein